MKMALSEDCSLVKLRVLSFELRVLIQTCPLTLLHYPTLSPYHSILDNLLYIFFLFLAYFISSFPSVLFHSFFLFSWCANLFCCATCYQSKFPFFFQSSSSVWYILFIAFKNIHLKY